MFRCTPETLPPYLYVMTLRAIAPPPWNSIQQACWAFRCCGFSIRGPRPPELSFSVSLSLSFTPLPPELGQSLKLRTRQPRLRWKARCAEWKPEFWSQHPHKKWGVAVPMCNPSTRGAERPTPDGALGLSSLMNPGTPGSVEDCLTKQGGGQRRETPTAATDPWPQKLTRICIYPKQTKPKQAIWCIVGNNEFQERRWRNSAIKSCQWLPFVSKSSISQELNSLHRPVFGILRWQYVCWRRKVHACHGGRAQVKGGLAGVGSPVTWALGTTTTKKNLHTSLPDDLCLRPRNSHS